MRDAWIYSPADREDGDAAHRLAELGYSPRRVTFNGSLRPPADDGATREPAVILVVADGPQTSELCARLGQDEDLRDVPLIVAVDAGAVADSAATDGHELILLPLGTAELSARIARARQRLGVHEQDEIVRIGTLEINVATYQVTVDGEPIDFTYMEYELLRFLATHPRRVFSREALLNRVWGYDYYGGTRTVDVHIRRVRAKLGSEHAQRIKTVRSVGYRLDA